MIKQGGYSFKVKSYVSLTLNEIRDINGFNESLYCTTEYIELGYQKKDLQVLFIFDSNYLINCLIFIKNNKTIKVVSSVFEIDLSLAHQIYKFFLSDGAFNYIKYKSIFINTKLNGLKRIVILLEK